jgi:hypothetical protein
MQVDVAPNLGRMLLHQKEDLRKYFAGTDQQLATLDGRVDLYRRNYRDYVAWYERNARREDD